MLIAALILTFALLAALGYAHHIEPGRIKRVHYTLDATTLQVKKQIRTKDRPAPNGVRLLFFSDLHAGPHFGERRLKRVAAAIAAEKPNVILCGGDLVTEESDLQDAAYYEGLVHFFQRLQETAPVAAVYGNHDVEAPENRDFVDRLYHETGVTILVNEVLEKEGFPAIYGNMEGFWGEPEPAPAGFHGIVLCHQPDLLTEVTKSVDKVLVLSGHTHRGQVTFFGIPIVRVPLGKIYTYGQYDVSPAKTLLVTSGIGTVHLPFRFGAPPELLIFDLV